MTKDFDLNVKELSRILGSSSQNTKKLINILEKRGYVSLKKDPSDGRQIRIALTDEGKEYYKTRSKRESLYLDQLFEGIDEVKLKEIYENMRLLSRTIISKEED